MISTFLEVEYNKAQYSFLKSIYVDDNWDPWLGEKTEHGYDRVSMHFALTIGPVLIIVLLAIITLWGVSVHAQFSTLVVICPLQSGPKVNLDWTLKEIEDGQEARA
jgi:hypothetical protein